MTKVAIMQPYFMPYIGYWQLINAVDEFVVYDNIQFTKKGWFHRNRFQHNKQPYTFTIPLKKDSDYLNVDERTISENAVKDIEKIVNLIKINYKNAPQFPKAFPIIEKCLNHNERNLFLYNLYAIEIINEYLNINTKITISSSIKIDHDKLKSQNKVIEICRSLGATTYINSIGGIDLYDKDIFKLNGIELQFLRAQLNPYEQNLSEFIPGLSIIDVMMFNDVDKIKAMLGDYELT